MADVPVKITELDTKSILTNLNTLFDVVMSGKDYNRDQVRNATKLSNSMVQILRFEFDVYKYFQNRVTNK